MIHLTIDGIPVEVEKGTTWSYLFPLLQAIRKSLTALIPPSVLSAEHVWKIVYSAQFL